MSDADPQRNASARGGGSAVAADAMDLATLMTLFSPAFPTGGFAYSHGLEAAVREGRVGDAGAVRGWVEVLLARGSGWNDLVLMAEAHRAAAAGEEQGLAGLAELARALSGSAERRSETLTLGAAFLAAARPWIGADGAGWRLSGAEAEMPLPVAAGAVACHAGLPLAGSLVAYAHSFSASLVSAAVRLVPLGQSEWVAVLRDLSPSVVTNARRAAGSTLDELGSAALVSEIAAMRHETLPTRLFRS